MFRCDIIGQGEAISVLDGAISSGHIAHAYLFVGPDGVGKRTCAMEFGKALLCELAGRAAPEVAIPCNRCNSCRAVTAGNHPNEMIISPDGASIKIDQVRNLQKEASLKAWDSKWRVWIFEDADRMTEEAANSLLKTLEDPPPSTVIVLVAISTSNLLPTIVSRCQIVRFGRVASSEIEMILKQKLNLPDEASRIYSVLADGAPGRALALAGGQEEDIRKRSLELTRIVGTQDTLEMLRFSSEFPADRDSVSEIFTMWITWYRDILILKITDNPNLLLNMDSKRVLSGWIDRYSVDQLIEAIQIIQASCEALRQNVNVRLCVDSTLLRLNRLLARGDSPFYADSCGGKI